MARSAEKKSTESATVSGRKKFGESCETFVYVDKFGKEHQMLCINPDANQFSQVNLSIGKVTKILAKLKDLVAFEKKFGKK